MSIELKKKSELFEIVNGKKVVTDIFYDILIDGERSYLNSSVRIGTNNIQIQFNEMPTSSADVLDVIVQKMFNSLK